MAREVDYLRTVGDFFYISSDLGTKACVFVAWKSLPKWYIPPSCLHIGRRADFYPVI